MPVDAPPRAAGCAALLLVAACAHGAPEERLRAQNVALAPDGSRFAVVVKLERFRSATGLAAFPDGGVPQMIEQRADVYIVSLPQRTVLWRREVPAPEAHRLSFEPWLMGWEGDTLYLRITGCPGRAGEACHGPLVRSTVYAIGPDGRVRPDPAPRRPVLVNTIRSASSYLSLGTERYGVSIATRAGEPRTPLMRYAGQALQPAPP